MFFLGEGGLDTVYYIKKCNVGDVSNVDVVGQSSLESFLEEMGYLLDFLETKRLQLHNGSSKTVISGLEAQLFQ